MFGDPGDQWPRGGPRFPHPRCRRGGMHPWLRLPGPLGIKRSIAQQLDPRVVGRITLRPRLQRVAVEVEAILSERRHDGLELLAAGIAIDSIAEAFDLVCAVA